MFADTSLATRIERAEMRLSVAIAETVASRNPGARVLVDPIAGGYAVFAGAGSPANKAIGIGFGATIDQAALDAIERAWAERGEAVRFELSTLADPSLAPTLSARGYRLTGFENVLGRPVTADDSGPSLDGMLITALPQDEWRTWMNVALDGFATPDGSAPGEESYPREALEGMFADFAATRGFQRYLLHVDGAPAGAASLRLDDGIAQLCGAATLPQFRRRGIQAALLRRRLDDAREAGCALAVVTTQPGSKSQANAMRQGFALLYTRAVLVKRLVA
jgi:ribosomal protein S18 acetylase RimI-like enzyme